MEKFAAYGFNKSHSAAYGLLTVQTAWLKAHYPVEFMAALISSEASNTDKVVLHISEARAERHRGAPAGRERVRRRVRRVPARPGLGRRARKGRIRFGLGAVRGVGDVGGGGDPRGAPARAGRSRASSTSPRGSTRSKINKKVVEALVKSGAFDFEGVPRWQLFAGIDAAFAAGASAQADRASRPGEPLRRAAGRAGRGEAALPEARRHGRRGHASRSGPSACASPSRRRRSGSTSPATRCQGYEKEVRRYASVHLRRGRARSATATRSRWSAWSRRSASGMNKEKGTRFGFLTLEDLTGTVRGDLLGQPARRRAAAPRRRAGPTGRRS